VNERRERKRATLPMKVAEDSTATRWMRRGATGLAVLAVGRWIWQATRPDAPDGRSPKDVA
jgi:hypothetical protein